MMLLWYPLQIHEKLVLFIDPLLDDYILLYVLDRCLNGIMRDLVLGQLLNIYVHLWGT